PALISPHTAPTTHLPHPATRRSSQRHSRHLAPPSFPTRRSSDLSRSATTRIYRPLAAVPVPFAICVTTSTSFWTLALSFDVVASWPSEVPSCVNASRRAWPWLFSARSSSCRTAFTRSTASPLDRSS